MNSYRVWFTETKTRKGFIDVHADSEDDAKDKVGNNYRYSPSIVTDKAEQITHTVHKSSVPNRCKGTGMTDRTDLMDRIFLAIAKTMPTKHPAAVLAEIETTHVLMPRSLIPAVKIAAEDLDCTVATMDGLGFVQFDKLDEANTSLFVWLESVESTEPIRQNPTLRRAPHEQKEIKEEKE